VLLVEGEDSLRELYAAELAAAGFLVLEASDGAAAIEKALKFGPQAVVLQLELEGLDGLKVVRRLRADDTALGIIALTSSSHKFGSVGLAAGCDSVLRKPVIAAALIGELIRLIARRTTHAGSGRHVAATQTIPDPVEAEDADSAEGSKR
jgi:DNA-binding response OmpR family regulator